MSKRKKRIQNKIIKYLFVTCLVCSMMSNLILYTELHEKKPQLYKGTYQTKIGKPIIYLLLDGQKNFCRYTQENGVIDSGTYYLTNSTYYTFNPSAGNMFYMFPSEDGFVYVGNECNETITYYHLSTALVYYEIPNNAWPKWCNKYKANSETN